MMMIAAAAAEAVRAGGGVKSEKDSPSIFIDCDPFWQEGHSYK